MIFSIPDSLFNVETTQTDFLRQMILLYVREPKFAVV